MSFVHPLLLGGLLLVGIPVLLHMIMRQKPKHLLFPAMRFLLERHRSNQRKLHLRHLLLLALRILLIAAIVLALARPKIFSQRLNLAGNRPIAAVLIFDTSYSMEYTLGDRTRLDEAKRRAFELLEDLPDNSRVAVLDTAEGGGEWLPSLSLVRDRITGLKLRPANYPVTSQLPHAYDLLAQALQEQASAEEAPLPFLYIFSDRTQGCWEANQLENLQHLRDQRLQAEVHGVFVDVGVDQPVDLGITRVEVKPRQIIPANERVEIDATVQAVGAAYEAQIVCRLDGQAAAERKPVKLEAGQSQVISFERSGLAEGWHQAEIILEGADHEVPFDNARFLTFRIQGPRRVLVITDHHQDAGFLTTALSAGGVYDCTVKETPEMKSLYPEELRKTYPAIFLLSVAEPDRELWEKLENYVQNGGGLAVLPGGEELDRTAYNDNQAAQALLPGRLIKVLERPQAVDWNWNQNNYQHPLLRPFQKWRQAGDVDFVRFPRRTFRYWAVQRSPDQDNTSVVVSYEDEGEDHQPAPAILERQLTQKDRRGRVLLFTTTLDRRSGWNNYIESLTSFYLVLAQLTAGYLSGDAEDGNFNYPCGQTVPVVLPDQVLYPTYTLQGPGLSAVDAVVTRPNNEKELLLSQALLPGNFSLFGGPETRTVADFSLNVPAEECQLARIPPEQIDALLGPNSVLSLDRKISLKEALQQHWSQPVELLPALLLLLLLVLAVENLLANKFYRKAVSDQPAAPGGVTSKEF